MQTILAFDFGMKRIGVAVGQLVTQTATPLVILKAVDGVPNWKEIEKLRNDWQADAFVVGIPYNMDGTEQQVTYAARRFAHKLRDKFKLPIHFIDERLTTKAANWALRADGSTPKKGEKVDNYAAKLILETWLKNNSQEIER